MQDSGSRGSDGWAARPGEAPGAVAAHLASRRQLLVDQFTRWVEDSPPRDGVAEVAGRLVERFSQDALGDLLMVADRMPANEAPGWVRQQFDGAVGAFGMALRAATPEALRHRVAQVLQLRLLEAERWLGEGLLGRWPERR